ncbi:chemotaxis response regulator protein-glutamate methylesterase [Thalassotalea sp. LPB0316]|uniref:protein-glutamate methylesterase/protein-glutamine glutaminase n=1 Tax=Thalassotalea sp. LPB0316 TaxID=2769490 RepID=UPI0018694EF1|nr:chemotaxis response regulator protein-glutamate methylesterase [Thalassotalea sp. LPB0316]QOL27110.1 chemotaxis response regulator protein-glutamate methylesterase [Thalassotalea sp. LPB0316]
MAYKVLVVDDSSFFRRRVSDILNSEANLEVIDVAVNGKEAVEKASTLKPDVITMDIEMPVLNGIEAVKQIMAQSPTPILMFSSLTHQGAKATLDALDAGALDFLPKKFNEIAANNDDAGALLRQRVQQLARRRVSMRRTTAPGIVTRKSQAQQTPQSQFATASKSRPMSNLSPANHRVKSDKNYKLLAIGTSTGGPIALQTILTKLPKDYPLPIILVQHMPAAFTAAFANRLNNLCQISIKEAEDGDLLTPGCAYLAPGGKQMVITGTENAKKLRILEDDSERLTYKPSVDISFGSAAKVYQGDVLAVILTGMGHDGREGSRMLKSKGATIWAQDEESCVVYGMPQAVTAAGISELSLPLNEFASAILKETGNG